MIDRICARIAGLTLFLPGPVNEEVAGAELVITTGVAVPLITLEDNNERR